MKFPITATIIEIVNQGAWDTIRYQLSGSGDLSTGDMFSVNVTSAGDRAVGDVVEFQL